MVSGVRLEESYIAIQYIHDTEKYPIAKLCAALKINRSSYYKWLTWEPSTNQLQNEEIIGWIKELYEEQNGILGYRQMTITINRVHSVCYNKKRIRRLMQILGLKSVCRIKKKSYIPSTLETEADNVLNREFYADAPNEKRLTDVTEFKYYVGPEIRKLYLSAILDLYDKRIVATRSVTATTINLSLTTSTKRLAFIRMLIRCFIVTVDFSTPAKHSITSSRKQRCGRVCPE